MNDDTISRQAAIDAILAVTGNSSVRELYEHVQEHGLSDMWSGGVNAAIDIIIAVPSAQPQDIARDIATIIENEKDMRVVLKQPRWIPCSERLPGESGRYLVTRGLNACGSLWNRIYIVNYSDLMGIKSERIWWQGNVGKPDFERLDDVLAWMPLPEPYKGE